MEESIIKTLKLLLKNKIFIIIFSIIGLFLGFFISSPFIMEPEFKSEAIIYPPANTNAKITAEFDLRFGSEKEIDEHIQILNSGILKEKIIEKYSLMEHYKIKKNAEDKLNKLYKEYDKNISIEKTKFNSISITVFDTDPKIAANIANDIVKLGDEVKSIIVKGNLYGTIQQINVQYNIKKNTFEELLNSLPELKIEILKYDFNNLENNPMNKLKIEMIINESINDAISSSDIEKTEKLRQLQYNFSEMSDLKKTINIANFNFRAKINGSYIITPAMVADKKFSPNRTLIILSSFFCSILVSISLVLFLEKWNSIRSQLV